MNSAEANEIKSLQTRYNEIEAGNAVSYTEIGRLYYKLNSENPAPEFETQFQKVKASIDQMKQIEKRIKFLNGIVVCDNCNMENSVNASFCSGCGTRLPHTFVSDGANRCPNCGGIITPGQRFCGTCGASTASAKLEEVAEDVAEDINETVNDEVVEDTTNSVETAEIDTPVVLPVETSPNVLPVEEAPAKSFCPNCGAEVLESDSLFCAECGTRLE